MEERLQKILSACGIASRRAAEGYITAGRVTVNGQVAGLGDKADPERDEIRVDGRPVRREEQRTYVLLHKPRGYVTTLSDEKGRKTVAQLVEGCGARVWPVGRLDLDSEGLLLLTDDGDLTHRLIHPSHEVEKEYRVWVQGDAEGALPVLTGPMTLDGAPLRRAKVKIIGRHGEETVLSFLIHEGKNRQIRRMCAMAGLEVRRLRRIREGPIRLGDLPPGTWRNLTEEEVSALKCLHF
ncbi:MAG TPA: rRNA pseudouridine synthase [Candidatus Flavonifractor merdipullorum]|uniref:Pseudouridine synthase n=1 Tax=Candidatus Flavonifractor merdipullorum TaxID=2838590 RepID=A0A9D1RW45_9FIRM|nr:rRNA pseudouridine synthase [Candidatus Flavonifractor merdipullorum]